MTDSSTGGPHGPLVLVTGLPASGKSTLAGALATALRLPLLAKDTVKETLADVLGAGGPGDVEWSGRLGAAAVEVVWRLAVGSPAGAVLDVWIRPDDRPRTAAVLAAAGRVPYEVWCACPTEEVVRRYAARRRHPVHKDARRLAALGGYAATAGPLALGPVLTVDTGATADPPVDVSVQVGEVIRWLGREAG